MDKHFTADSTPSGAASPTLMHPQQVSLTLSWDDKELFIRKAFDEDPRKGCELLFKHYYPTLCNHAVRYVYAKDIAQDLVGEIFYTFWKKQLHLHITSSYRAYLFVSVRNRALKHIQKEFGKATRLTDVSEIDPASALPSPQQILQYNELSLKIEHGIQSLAPQCQKIFLLNRFEGKKYQEIATELKVSLKTVEAHISKALHVLRKAVRDEIIVLFLLVLVG